MNKQFEYGFELIECGIKRRNKENIEKQIHDIYWFAQMNGLNQKYDSESELRSELIGSENSINETTEATEQEIMQKVKKIIEGM